MNHHLSFLPKLMRSGGGGTISLSGHPGIVADKYRYPVHADGESAAGENQVRESAWAGFNAESTAQPVSGSAVTRDQDVKLREVDFEADFLVRCSVLKAVYSTFWTTAA